MKLRSKTPPPCNPGFSLVEILVASAIAAMVVSASVSMLGAIATNRAGIEKTGRIDLTHAVALDIGIPIPAPGEPNYVDPVADPTGGNWVREIQYAPSIALSADMEIIRSELAEDISHAAAVFCVARNSNASYRDVNINYPFGNDARALAEPGRFEALLNSLHGTNIFVPYRGAAPDIAAAPGPITNYSIYVLNSQTIGQGNNSSSLRVLGLYEVDFVTIANPAGTYVAIKYWNQKGTNVQLGIGSNIVEVFYPQEGGVQDFQPPFVQFERADRQLNAEPGIPGINEFKIAQNKPFYFAWFPDPAAPLLEAPSFPPVTGVRSTYSGVSGRTPYFFVIPMFPAL